MPKGVIVAVESSFDDAALAAISPRGEIIAGFTASQSQVHSEWGGVVPELASRSHLVDLPPLYAKLRESFSGDDVEAVAVTRGPGLAGSLLVGVNYARGLATGLSVPCMGLNHLEGHIVSPFLDSASDNILRGRSLDEIPFPHLALVVSGGNTLLVEAHSLGQYSVLGETLDDAGGELLDKIAVKLGHSYPGGATIERLASEADLDNPEAIAWLDENRLPVPMADSGDLNFSYSGLKTAAVRLIEEHGITRGHTFEPFLASELLRVLTESLWIKVEKCLESRGEIEVFTVSGGVAANERILSVLGERLAEIGVKMEKPPEARIAVDNAEMMAYLAWLYVERDGGVGKEFLDFDAEPNLRL